MITEPLYMAVTADEYELPVYIGSAASVAAFAGMSTASLYSYITRGQIRKRGNAKNCKFVRVEPARKKGTKDGAD